MALGASGVGAATPEGLILESLGWGLSTRPPSVWCSWGPRWRTTSAGLGACAHGSLAFGVVGHSFRFAHAGLSWSRGAGRGVCGLCPSGGLGSRLHRVGLRAVCRDPSVPSAHFVARAPSPSLPPRHREPSREHTHSICSTVPLASTPLPAASVSAGPERRMGAVQGGGEQPEEAVPLPACEAARLLNPAPTPVSTPADRPPCELGDGAGHLASWSAPPLPTLRAPRPQAPGCAPARVSVASRGRRGWEEGAGETTPGMGRERGEAGEEPEAACPGGLGPAPTRPPQPAPHCRVPPLGFGLAPGWRPAQRVGAGYHLRDGSLQVPRCQTDQVAETPVTKGLAPSHF